MFTEKLWAEWLEKELKHYAMALDAVTGKPIRKYLKKGYLHLDDRYWLPEFKDDFKTFISNSAKVEKRGFFPFLKVVHNTPRFRFDGTLRKRVIDFKQRPICFASHFDSLIYSYYSHFLTKTYEEYILRYGIQDVVLAYRTDLDMCNMDFSKEIFDYIRSKDSCVAIALDIKGFFDNLDHDILKEKWIQVLGNELDQLPAEQYKIFRSLTKYRYINKNTILSNLSINLSKLPSRPKSLLELVPGKRDFEKFRYMRSRNIIATNFHRYGIPQGSPMSAVLSNIYMIDFDRELLDIALENGCLYRRYCDDILFICPIDKADEIKNAAYDKISDCKLNIQKKKEEEIIFKVNLKGQFRAFDAKKVAAATSLITLANEQTYYKPLQYLGFEYNGKNIMIRSSSTSRYFRKMKARVDKTVKMAYSDSGKGNKLMKRKLLHRYTHLGKRNFISYALNASKSSYQVASGSVKIGMDSPAIRKQISKHYEKLMADLIRKNLARIDLKHYKGKLKRIKQV
jgi:RNA-directed DNA polymerase